MRQRYFNLTGKAFYPIERQLRLDQIIALRIAGDEELARLTEQSFLKKLSTEEIKLQIKDWQGDNRRV